MASNVCIKLNTARMLMQNAHIKQNGKNKFAGWKYFELSDILPASNKICSEIGATIYTQFDDKAHLFFVDTDTGEKIEFTLPMSTAELKGCHEVQNLGAVQTYLKRYLYQNCFEISEKDVLDYSVDTTDEDTPQKPQETPQKPGKFKYFGNGPTIAEIKQQALDVVNEFDSLYEQGFIPEDSYKNFHNAYDSCKVEADYQELITRSSKNISDAKKLKEIESAKNLVEVENLF